MCETKTNVVWNIHHSYYMCWTLTFSILCYSIPVTKKIKFWSWLNMIHMSGKFSLTRFFLKICLKGSLLDSLMSEEDRQPWTTQKEVIRLQELNMNENPNLSYTHWDLPPEHEFYKCFHVTFGKPQRSFIDMDLFLAESLKMAYVPIFYLRPSGEC